MRPSPRPATSRGRDRHVVALLVVPDAVLLEVAVAQQVFGPRIAALDAAPREATPLEATAPRAATEPDTASPYDVVLCGERPRQPLHSGADLGELAPLDTLARADTVLVPGVEDPLAPRAAPLLASVREAHAAGARMVSFCAGAFLLAGAGVLDGRRATTHWLFSEDFRRSFPAVRLEPGLLYVDDGPVHTSGGVFSATDLALHLLALDLGQAYANDVARLLVSAPHRQGGQAQFAKDELRAARQPPTGSFLGWLRDHVHEPLTLAELARHEHMSERSLARRFQQETGMSVFDWITRERVDRAKELLETTDHRVTEIAVMAGFGSYETFRRNFERTVGTTAVAYRNTFRRAPAAPAP